jgi:hypothetical protein
MQKTQSGVDKKLRVKQLHVDPAVENALIGKQVQRYDRAQQTEVGWGEREGSLRKWLRRVPPHEPILDRTENRSIQICPDFDGAGSGQATLDKAYGVSGD